MSRGFAHRWIASTCDGIVSTPRPLEYKSIYTHLWRLYLAFKKLYRALLVVLFSMLRMPHLTLIDLGSRDVYIISMQKEMLSIYIPFQIIKQQRWTTVFNTKAQLRPLRYSPMACMRAFDMTDHY